MIWNLPTGAVLLWSEMGQLKDFLEITGEIDELVAAWRTLRFQFICRDTPPEVIRALGDTLEWVSRAINIDVALVDRVIDRLEKAEADTFALDAPIHVDG